MLGLSLQHNPAESALRAIHLTRKSSPIPPLILPLSRLRIPSFWTFFIFVFVVFIVLSIPPSPTIRSSETVFHSWSHLSCVRLSYPGPPATPPPSVGLSAVHCYSSNLLFETGVFLSCFGGFAILLIDID